MRVVNHYFATEDPGPVEVSRQPLLLYYSIPEIPLAIWGGGVRVGLCLTALMVFPVGTRRKLSAAGGVQPVAGALLAMVERCCSTRPTSVWALRCGPVAMEASLTWLVVISPGAEFGVDTCERFATDEVG